MRLLQEKNPGCVYMLDHECRLPEKKSCWFCLRFRRPIRGVSLFEHLQLDEERRKRHLSLTVALLSFCVALISLAVSLYMK